MDSINKLDTTHIKDMDLLNKTYRMDYDNYVKNVVNNHKMISKAGGVLNKIFDKDKDDIGKAILMSYAFSSYGDDIFRPYKTNIDQKLIRYSNKVIKYLTNIIKGEEIDDNFYLAINKYYSLFTIWQSREKIKEITKIHQNLVDKVESNNVMLRLGIPCDETEVNNEIKSKYDEMKNMNMTVTISIFMRSYSVFKGYCDFMDYIWGDISVLNSNLFWEVILIVIVDIKGRLISVANDINIKKKLYYSIDTDAFTKKIYKNELTTSDIVHIFTILNSYLESINENPIPLNDMNDMGIGDKKLQPTITCFLADYCKIIY